MARSPRDWPSVEFWEALEAAGGSPLEADVLDVGTFVTSRGEKSAEAFEEDLDRAIARLASSGVAAEAHRYALTADGDPCSGLSSTEFGSYLECILLWRPEQFFTLLNEPSLIRDAVLNPVNIRGALLEARSRQGSSLGPKWEKKRGDYLRDGSLWLQVHPAVEGTDSRNFVSGDYFARRWSKEAWKCALDDDWRSLRDQVGAKQVDIWVEYVTDRQGRVAVDGKARKLLVLIRRPVLEVDRRSGTELEVGTLEVRDALEQARIALLSRLS